MVELKVWVDGIQRVICGVTESTSCQDVVIALAQATGRTGRFTLIEKWRDNERLLSPSDNPLKILHKWGEYAHEVQFVLRQRQEGKQRTDKFLHNFTPPPSHGSVGGGNSATSIKKSLTFSGAHNYSFQTKPSARVQPRHAIQENSSLESLEEEPSASDIPLSKHSTENISTSYAKSGGPPSSSSSYSSSPYSSLDKKHYQGAFQRVTNSSATNSTLGGGQSSGQPQTSALFRSRNQPYPGVGRSPVASIAPQVGGGSWNHGHSHAPSPLTDIEKSPQEFAQYDQNQNAKGIVENHQDLEELDLDQSLAEEAAKLHIDQAFGLDEYRNIVPAKTQTDDLIELINMQHEKLVKQEAQLKDLDEEIQYWEKQDRESSHQASLIEDEIKRLEYAKEQYELEMKDTDSVKLEEELQLLQQNDKTLQSEITLFKSKTSNSETDLLQSKNKIRLLLDDIDEEKLALNKRQQEEKEEELKILSEVSKLQKELKDLLTESEQERSKVEEVEKEVKEVEESLITKKKEITNLEQGIKTVNLELFMKTPTELHTVEIADVHGEVY
ncbi:uncharacterized protein LOC106174059 isoform X2 [Lingula anatina]|uniref:Uncharacterized protein LOC106174059 isoform X2 n=1 Tax=Lingula anatina TaxID=7574 RepID=A0A1S3JKE8_LINAN|nr:uncharacterized protein LOC106174059 isoform X2 [Lingula anatina]|eukprot:XP_013410895.1 uncharacterized protein LOC106174059 isoform X2 [Lingula anatina]